MPHVIVKLWPGKSAGRKQALADAIVTNVTAILGYDDEAVSVAFEEVSSQDWTKKVVDPDIVAKWETLAREPGYVRRPGGRRP